MSLGCSSAPLRGIACRGAIVGSSVSAGFMCAACGGASPDRSRRGQRAKGRLAIFRVGRATHSCSPMRSAGHPGAGHSNPFQQLGRTSGSTRGVRRHRSLLSEAQRSGLLLRSRGSVGQRRTPVPVSGRPAPSRLLDGQRVRRRCPVPSDRGVRGCRRRGGQRSLRRRQAPRQVLGPKCRA